MAITMGMQMTNQFYLCDNVYLELTSGNKLWLSVEKHSRHPVTVEPLSELVDWANAIIQLRELREINEKVLPIVTKFGVDKVQNWLNNLELELEK
jgi:hypothetical protein